MALNSFAVVHLNVTGLRVMHDTNSLDYLASWGYNVGGRVARGHLSRLLCAETTTANVDTFNVKVKARACGVGDRGSFGTSNSDGDGLGSSAAAVWRGTKRWLLMTE